MSIKSFVNSNKKGGNTPKLFKAFRLNWLKKEKV